MPAPLLLSQTRRWSGNPAAFDRHGASTTPPDGYFYTSPGLMRSWTARAGCRTAL